MAPVHGLYLQAKQEVHTNEQDPRSNRRRFPLNVSCSKKTTSNTMKVHQTADEIDPWTEGNKQGKQANQFADSTWVYLLTTLALNLICWLLFAWLITTAISLVIV
jgi:hypothetical protein